MRNMGSRQWFTIGLCTVARLLLAQRDSVPLVTSRDFLEWVPAYVDQCVQSVPLERPTVYYFSPDGHDDTGTGSPSNPYKTIAKANDVIDRSSGNIRLRWRIGGVYRSTVGLVVNKPNVTVDSYRLNSDPTSAPKPLLTRFDPPVSNQAWQPTGDAGVFRTTVATPVAWVKYVGDESTVFRRMLDLAECRATQGSWFWDASGLYVHTFSNHSLVDTDRAIEYVVKNNLNGIWVTDQANVRLHNLRVEGFGAGTPGDYSYSGYGIRYDGVGSHRCVVTECESYYNGRHSMTKVGDGIGGSFVLVRCRMGWLVNDSINVVGYSSLGGQELVTAHCEFLGSELPSTNKPFPYGGGDTPLYLHTSNDSLYKQSLFLSYNDRIVPGQYQCAKIPVSNCAPGFSTLSSARSFVVGLNARCRSKSALDESKPSANGGNGTVFRNLGSEGTVYVNCRVEPTVLWSQGTGDVALLTSSAGVWINSELKFDFSQIEQANWNRVLSLSPVNATLSDFRSSFYACRLEFVGTGGGCTVGFSGPMVHRYGSLFNSMGAKWQGLMRSCIVQARRTANGKFLLGWGNAQEMLLGNAYYGLTTEGGAYGVDQDWARVTGTTAFGVPTSDSPLTNRKQILIDGAPLQYDIHGHARPSHPTLGPEEAGHETTGLTVTGLN